MSLIEAINTVGKNNTNDTILSFLNEDIVLLTDTKLYTVSQLKIALDNNLDDLRLVLGTLKAAGEQDPLIWGFSQKIMSTGISFADTETQAMIDVLAVSGGWSNSVRDKIKSIGIVRGKRHLLFGLNLLPLDADITEAKLIIAKRDWASYIINEIINPMTDNSSYTINDIKTLINNS